MSNKNNDNNSPSVSSASVSKLSNVNGDTKGFTPTNMDMNNSLNSNLDNLLLTNPKYKYLSEIQQMMFVFGEQDPLLETIQLIEDIVRTQIINILIGAVEQLNKRGSRYLTVEDLIFLVRRDPQKVNRLRTYLSWKDIRKNVRDKDGRTNDIAEDIIAEEASQPNAPEKSIRIKRNKIDFSWDTLSIYKSVLYDDDDDDSSEDEEDLENYEDQIKRLKMADEATKYMTNTEYINYSTCRQASFVYKKGRKFREWCHMAQHYDNKPNPDVIDILGFLSYEIVSKLTETAIEVKNKWDNLERNEKANSSSLFSSLNSDDNTLGLSNMDQASYDSYLFGRSSRESTQILPVHVHEAFRILNMSDPPLNNFDGSFVPSKYTIM